MTDELMLEIHNFTQNKIDEKLFQKTAESVLKIAGSSTKLEYRGKIEISLAIVGDGRMRRLNKMYRGKNRVTDVLSFGDKSVVPYLTKAFPRFKIENSPVGEKFIGPPDGIKRLGEIVICYSRAKKQAKRIGHSLKKELTILLIHGILHLLGYDHEENKEEAEKMTKMEAEILSKIGIF